jgi:hypothetical protein
MGKEKRRNKNRKGPGETFRPSPRSSPRPRKPPPRTVTLSLADSTGPHVRPQLRLPRVNHASNRASPPLPPLQSRVMPTVSSPMPTPIRRSRPPLLFPFFPLPIALPGPSNLSPENRTAAAVQARFRHSQVTPTPPIGTPLTLLSVRTSSCPRYNFFRREPSAVS